MSFNGVMALLRVVFVGALLSFPVATTAAASELDKLDKGPKIGAAIPQPFEAKDQNGRTQNFASLTGQRGLILLFSRSLDW